MELFIKYAVDIHRVIDTFGALHSARITNCVVNGNGTRANNGGGTTDKQAKANCISAHEVLYKAEISVTPTILLEETILKALC